MNTSEPSAIKRAVEIFGSQLALAKALGVVPVTVNQWVKPKGQTSCRPIPPKQCVRIEQLTGGRVTRRDLRPSDWQDIWPELEASDQKQPSTLDAQPLCATNGEVFDASVCIEKAV